MALSNAGTDTNVFNEATDPKKDFTVTVTPATDLWLRLGPSWLQAKGADSFASVGQVQIYLDENHLGGPETLRSITPTSIYSIRHWRALDATARWGINHDKGAIVVSTRP